MGNTDPGDFDLIIGPAGGGTGGLGVVSEFTGADFNPVQSTSPNEGPGGRRFNFNFQRSANGCDVSFTTRDTSEHIDDLIELCRLQQEVSITVKAVRNVDKYDDGELQGFYTPRAVLSYDSLSEGRGESEDVSFSAQGIGYQIFRKNIDPIDQGVNKAAGSA